MAFYAELLNDTAAERARLQSLPIIQDALSGRVTLSEYQRFPNILLTARLSQFGNS